MVNYQDPVTILREYSAYAFLLWFSGLQFGLLVGPSNSGDGEALARRGWYIYVSIPVLPHWTLSSTRLLIFDPPLPVGNSLQPLTMSGMSSEGIARTDGRYGFVDLFFFFWFCHRPLHDRGMNLTCYRFTPLRAYLPFWL